MIHILHPQTDKIIGFLDNNESKVCLHSEHYQHLSGVNTFKVTVLQSSTYSDVLEGRVRLLIPSERGGFQEMVSYEIEAFGDKTIYGVGAEVELNKQKIIAPAKHSGLTLKQYVNLAVADTEYQARNIEYHGAKTLTFKEDLGSYDFLSKVSEDFDVELVFSIETSGSDITGRFVDAIEKQGSYEGKEIEYGKDLLTIEKKTFSDRIVTALICLGPIREDGTRLRLTVSDDEAFDRWGRNGKHILGIFITDSTNKNMTVEQLTTLGEGVLKRRIDSIDEYTITAATIETLFPNEKVRLGDSIRVKNTEYEPPLYAEARILSVKRSIFDEAEKVYVIGNVVVFDEEDILKVFRELQEIYGLRVLRSPTPPEGAPGFIWIQTDPIDLNFEVAHSWNEDLQKWVALAPTEAGDIGAETPEGALSQALELYYNIVNTEKSHLDNKYSSIYNNADLLSGTTKTDLLNAKNSYNTSYTNLISSIDTARADGVTSSSEKVDVDNKYNLYRGAIATLATRFEESTRAIEQEKMLNSRFYTWIKYADSPTTGMADLPTGKKYLGIAYNKESPTESSIYSDYSWSLIEGEKGDTGIVGPPGVDGESLYTWIKYADDVNGNGLSDLPTGKSYLGISYNQTVAAESANPLDYSWSLLEGPQGIQGPIGANGQTLYTWIKYSDTPTTGMADVPSGKKYLGIAYNKTSPTESNTYADYAWSLIEGPVGSQGVAGPVGPNGEVTYTWIKYADSPTTGISDSPTGKKYLGIAYNKQTQTESSVYLDYSWSLIEGPQGIQGPAGSQGIQGPIGPQGQATYTWLKYADSPTTGMNDSPTGKNYIGLAYNKTIATESLTYADYTWSLIKGETGNTGVQGPSGPDGESLYTWIKYGSSSTGTGITDSPTGMTYIGVAYNKTVITESNVAADYTWSLIQGPTGSQGIPGPTGPTGATLYSWLKYADSPTTGMSDLPTGKTYMGIAYNKSVALESSVYSDYTWSLIKGEVGNQGIPGPTGPNGAITYTWIKYGTSAAGAGLSDSPTGKTYIGIAYNKTTATESATATDYEWSLIQGPQGVQGPTGPQGSTGIQGIQGPTGNTGIQGPVGANGVSSYTHIAYATNATGTTGFSTSDPVGKTYMGMYVDTIATDSTNAALYNWSLIKGADGTQGIQGPTGANGQTSYLHIAYATNATGSTGFSTTDPVGKTYIGTYTDFISADSATASLYSWSLIKGDTGATGPQGPTGLQGIQGPTGSTGIQGPVGANGVSSYTHIAYATNSNGTAGFSVSDSVGKTYIGMYVDSTPADSTNPALYAWTLIKGADGSQGIQGPVGANGQTSYLHIAYATSSNGATGFSTTVSTGKTYIGQYTDFTAADSASYTAYQWTLIQGPTGATGPGGATGPQGPTGPTGPTGGTGATGATGPVGAIGAPGENFGTGTLVYKDPEFRDGVNSVTLYNNAGNGAVAVTRVVKPADAPSLSTHAMLVKATGTGSPGIGGFVQGITARANAKFIVRYIMKVPADKTISLASNSMGTGYTDKLVTPNVGTGKYEEYIRVIECGTTGTFSSGGHVYFSGGATPTLAAPMEVYISSIQLFDVTFSDYRVDDWTYGSTVEIDGGKIRADTVTATQIFALSLESLSANLGAITAGSITGVTLNLAGGKFIVDAAGNVLFKGDMVSSTDPTRGLRITGAGEVRAFDPEYTNGRKLFDITDTLPILLDGNQSGGSVNPKNFAKMYTRTFNVSIPAASYTTGSRISIAHAISDYTEVAIANVMTVQLAVASKEWRCYETDSTSRVYGGGDLSSINLSVSPNFAYTSGGTTIQVTMLIVGMR